jgi:glycosyltransferase involved in cell wall biosynthesis
MTVVEAQARGCAVLASDAPTMNEYVDHGRTGFLFRPPAEPGRLSRFRVRAPRPYGALPLCQDWAALARLDLAAAGDLGRREHAAGHERWLAALPGYAAFIGDW